MVATLTKNTAGTSWSVGDERSYDVWGGVRSGAATGGPKGRYVANLGHVQDDESGLIYMRARYYEPESGRFVSEDPGFDGVNWYIYCDSDPINYFDQNGKNFQSIKLWAYEMMRALMLGVYISTTISGGPSGGPPPMNRVNELSQKVKEEIEKKNSDGTDEGASNWLMAQYVLSMAVQVVMLVAAGKFFGPLFVKLFELQMEMYLSAAY